MEAVICMLATRMAAPISDVSPVSEGRSNARPGQVISFPERRTCPGSRRRQPSMNRIHTRCSPSVSDGRAVLTCPGARASDSRARRSTGTFQLPHMLPGTRHPLSAASIAPLSYDIQLFDASKASFFIRHLASNRRKQSTPFDPPRERLTFSFFFIRGTRLVTDSIDRRKEGYPAFYQAMMT